MNTDYIIIEGNLDRIKNFVSALESEYKIDIIKNPTLGLTMVRANDSVENQEFYLGEALITETEVSVNNTIGLGICLGDEPTKSYCMAFVDAVLQLEDKNYQKIEDFLHQEAKSIVAEEKKANHQIQKTKVDFKLMEQS